MVKSVQVTPLWAYDSGGQPGGAQQLYSVTTYAQAAILDVSGKSTYTAAPRGKEARVVFTLLSLALFHT